MSAGRKPSISTAQHKEFAEDWIAGITQRLMAEKYRCSEGTIRQMSKKLGLPNRKRPSTWAHGPTGYSAHGCRCEVCTKGNRDRMRLNQEARKAKAKDPNDPRHGKQTFYTNHGCRCEPCSAAQREACKAYYHAQKAKLT